MAAILHTNRLVLRPPVAADGPALAAINGDAAVMRHFPKPLDVTESEAFRERIARHFAEHGYGFWVVERQGAVVGLVGLLNIPWTAWFTPAVEIGWRIAAAHQRQGYAEEAARAALAHGFDVLGLDEIVAFTIPANAPSWALMEKLGMARDGGFDHPNLPEGHPMRRHLLYRLRAGERNSVRAA
ncbi:GNAT family N-acetyltransferase [Roseococcus sp. SDR]|uniref:GNAT family N-acetyltransferase n=1 Tax=Roseococcus sp. SDR TaxID=2835532 RepID=UPI001BCD9E21|nr:GNAT family N-acetyltransferase [Roseococcus sp. SDR]MBS7788528.1 GNAT family N-acetyltransferase [Roseococcus sp. SDR]MBV1843842.1 GNAT family N-acetyltransferase [Roseococcus sp. SDR]